MDNTNVLLNTLEKVRQYELTEREYPYTATGLISVEKVIEILGEMEEALRQECEAKFLEIELKENY